jgi:hypothetical protein
MYASLKAWFCLRVGVDMYSGTRAFPRSMHTAKQVQTCTWALAAATIVTVIMNAVTAISVTAVSADAVTAVSAAAAAAAGLI